MILAESVALCCGAVRCGAVRCGVAWFGVALCDGALCSEVRCKVVPCRVVSCRLNPYPGGFGSPGEIVTKSNPTLWHKTLGFRGVYCHARVALMTIATDRIEMAAVTKYLPEESQMPRSSYNIQADLPTALPPVLHPGTLQPIGPADLVPLVPLVSHLKELGLIEAVACTQDECFAAGELTDETYDENELAMALAGLPSVPR